jgi:hypothetical protein
MNYMEDGVDVSRKLRKGWSKGKETKIFDHHCI